jgi:hypothetical protein
MQPRLGPLKSAHQIETRVPVGAVKNRKECNAFESWALLQDGLAEGDRSVGLIRHGTDNAEHSITSQQRLPWHGFLHRDLLYHTNPLNYIVPENKCAGKARFPAECPPPSGLAVRLRALPEAS